MTISCNQETEIDLPASGVKRAVLMQCSTRSELKITRNKKGILVKVPFSKNALLVLE